MEGAPLSRVLAAVSSSPAHTKAKMAVLGHLMGEAHGSAILAANTAVVPRLWRYLQQDVLPDLQVRGQAGGLAPCRLSQQQLWACCTPTIPSTAYTRFAPIACSTPLRSHPSQVAAAPQQAFMLHGDVT